MEVASKVLFGVAAAGLLWILHRWIGAYPPPLPRSPQPRRAAGTAVLLWLTALATESLRVVALTPRLERMVPDPTLRELVQAPLLSLPYLALPLFVVVRRGGWSAMDLGLVLTPRSRGVAVFAVAFGALSGSVPFLTGQAVMGYDPLPPAVFVLLLYTNAFLEEFFHRGVVQAKLERALGQARAVLYGGVLFGLTHVAFDVARLLETQGAPAVALAVLLQGMAGSLFGIIYIKTRSLWPGVACHYLINWLSAILAAAFRS
jgi:membrane protease YdiL (CAAX protease family)